MGSREERSGIRFRLLGAVQVGPASRCRSLRRPLEQSLLAILLLEVNRTVLIDDLIARLWGDRLPGTPRDTLASHVARLRAVLAGSGARLPRGAGGYRLDTDAQQIDVHRFRSLLSRSRAVGGTQGTELLDEALSLWQGPPFPGTSSPWLLRVRETLNTQRLTACLDRSEALIAAGRPEWAVDALHALAEESLLDERLISLLMTALSLSGRRADALTVYEQARRRFAEDLGIDPSGRLRDVFQAVLRDDIAPGSVQYPGSLRSGSAAHS